MNSVGSTATKCGGHTRRALWLFGVLGLCLVPRSAPAALAKPVARRCDRHVRGADARTGKLVVYHDKQGSYFACLRPAGQGLRLGPPRGLRGSVARYVRAAGPYVMAEFDNSPAVSECIMRSPSGGCPPFVYDISLLDVKQGRKVDIHVKHPIAAVALSPAGAVAWADGYDSSGVKQLQGTALRARGRSELAAAPRVIYNGAVDLKSLRFTGLTLHWTSGGRSYQKTLS